MLDFKSGLEVAFKPQTLAKKAKTFNYRDGVKTILVFLVALLVVNVAFAAAEASLDGREMAAVVNVSVLSSLIGLIVTTVSLFIIGALAAMTARYAFHTAGNIEKTFGAMSYAVAPIFVIGVLANLVNLFSASANLTRSIFQVEAILGLVSLLWLFYIGVQAVKNTNKTNLAGAIVSMLVGLFVAMIVSFFLTDFLALSLAPMAFG